MKSIIQLSKIYKYLLQNNSQIWLNYYKNKLAYTYLIESIKRFPNQIELTKKIEEVGLKNVKVIDILGGVATIHICEKS